MSSIHSSADIALQGKQLSNWSLDNKTSLQRYLLRLKGSHMHNYIPMHADSPNKEIRPRRIYNLRVVHGDDLFMNQLKGACLPHGMAEINFHLSTDMENFIVGIENSHFPEVTCCA